jgi:hypothetical protein
MPIDLRHAWDFISCLTGNPSTPMSWQVFDDNPQRRDPSLATVRHGSLSEVSYLLGRANDNGCGVFATVNETDLRGRRAANVTRIRALYIDTDGFVPESYHLPPTFVVRSFSGVHAYWVLADSMPLHDFRDAQKRLIAHYRSDPKIHNLDRVMRVPGFLHRKGTPFAVSIASSTDARYTVAEVLAGLAPLPKRPAPRVARRTSLAGVDWSSLDVVDIFSSAGFSPRDLGGGKWAVICPWTGEHSHPDFHGTTTSTVIWERSAGSPATFHCAHAHCDGRKLADALSFIGYRPSPADVAQWQLAKARALYERTVSEQGVCR